MSRRGRRAPRKPRCGHRRHRAECRQDFASGQFDNVIPQVAYEVTLGADGRSLAWTERTTQGELRYDAEPGASGLQRMGVEWMSMLPIVWLLKAMATTDRSALWRARTAIA